VSETEEPSSGASAISVSRDRVVRFHYRIFDEAGGVVETLDGSHPFPLLPERDYGKRDYPILTAATPQEIAKAHSQIQPKDQS